MKLTIEQIANHSPCGDGAKWFREFYPNGLDLVSWTRDEQLRAITSGGHRYLGWAVAKGLVPMWAMVGANLVEANLDGASLVGAYLVGANLDGASLVGAYLVGASLDGASLYRANLVGAYLVGAYLVGANLVGANLVGASLDGANLVGANLDGANLVEANLDGARIPAKYKEQFSEQGYNLEGVIWIFGGTR